MKDTVLYPRVRPAADIMVADGGLWILANMPGVKFEDLDFLLEEARLHVQGSSRCPRPEAGGRDLRNLEFGNVEFELDIVMDAPLSAPLKATFDQGVLSVFLPGETHDRVRVL